MTDLDKLKRELATKSEFLSSRQCPGHSGKWPRGRCLQCEIERLQAALQKIADQDEHMFHEIGIARKALNE